MGSFHALGLDLLSDIYESGGVKRRGRPTTGHQPRLSVRMDRAALDAANEQARTEGKTVGQWLEEAIREKLAREASETAASQAIGTMERLARR